MNPSPSASNSVIIFRRSSSLDSWPRLDIMESSSDDEIFPSPLTSNFLNTCSSSSTMGLSFQDEVLDPVKRAAADVGESTLES
uniref:Uncharacterized protein n=1 Tax=Rhizophora mucronata TaxID=61149 RepID=A0A2P2PSV7_RHIMU